MTKQSLAIDLEFVPYSGYSSAAPWGELKLNNLHLEVFGTSIAGRGETRKGNQDYLSLPHKGVEQAKQNIANGGIFFAVADGVRGSDQGNTASKIAITEVVKNYYANIGSEETDSKRTALLNAIREAHQLVRKRREATGQSMSTTFLCAIVTFPIKEGDVPTINFACVGDSRAYVLSNNSLQQITEDSSWYEDELALGGDRAKYAQQQVEANPKLTQAPRTIGGIPDPDLKVDFFGPFELKEGDTFLLCTDGVYNVHKPSITKGLQKALVNNQHNLAHSAKALLDSVQQRSNHDDSTLILIKRKGKEKPTATLGNVDWSNIILVAVIIALLITLYFIARPLINNPSSPTPTLTPTSTTTQTATVVSVVLTETPTPTYSPSPTSSPSPIVTATSVTTSTSMPQLEATSTLTPTPPPTLTPTFTPTPSPTWTAIPTVPPTLISPPITPVVIPTITLTPIQSSGKCKDRNGLPIECTHFNPPMPVEPAEGASVVPGIVIFKWNLPTTAQDIGKTLDTNEYYDLKLYHSEINPQGKDTLPSNNLELPVDFIEKKAMQEQPICGQVLWSIQVAFRKPDGEWGGFSSLESPKRLLVIDCDGGGGGNGGGDPRD